MMEELNYVAPETLELAVELASAATGGAKILAGGTDLIVQIRARSVEPRTIIDIKRIPDMTKIVVKNGKFHIGAAVTGVVLSEHVEIKGAWPGVVESMELIGSTQIQGRATLGGNLCNGSPAADTVPALIAADAIAEVIGINGKREIPIGEFLTGPGTSVLSVDEILVSITLPKRPTRSGDAYLRFIPRTEMDIAAVGVGVNLSLDQQDFCTSAKISLGAVAEKALLVSEAEALLVGTKMEGHVIDELSNVAMSTCKPIDDKRGTKEFKTHVVGTLIHRTVAIAFKRARLN